MTANNEQRNERECETLNEHPNRRECETLVSKNIDACWLSGACRLRRADGSRAPESVRRADGSRAPESVRRSSVPPRREVYTFSREISVSTDITDFRVTTAPVVFSVAPVAMTTATGIAFAAIAIATVVVIPMPAFAQMWSLALILWLVSKCLAWRAVVGFGATRCPSFKAAFGFFLGWPGMDAKPFLAGVRHADSATVPRRSSWLGAAGKTASGAILFAVAVTCHDAANPLLSGWLAMLGMVVLLHFGLFELIALAWRRVGVAVEPIMRRPSRTTSLADFWGRRWNLGFRDVADQLLFRPLRRRIGPTLAMLLTFAVSGLIHDLVISVPARGGFGLPTLYFLIQGAAIAIERSHGGGRVPDPLRRVWMCVALAAPIGLLFHRPFATNVIAPMLDWIAAQSTALDAGLATLVHLGGLMHFGILIASALVPKVLDWRGELARLSPLTRQLVWVHGIFIVFTIVSLGAIATINAPSLAAGDSLLARSVSAFACLFWLTRLTLQFVLFDARPYLNGLALKFGYHGLTLVFAYLSAVFGWAAVRWV
jgi:alginate O-acetyltransferase complex protein AlgI